MNGIRAGPETAMTMTDRNRQYGTIAVKNNWITAEQLKEALALVARVVEKDPQRKFQLEDVLLEKGLISDVQHQAVLGVLERLTTQQRKQTSKRQPKVVVSAPPQTVKCPHCGATNPRGTEECRECEGFIPLDGDEKQIGLIQSRTCPTCTRGLGPDDLECGCGAMFCPSCKGLRLITEPTCRHCNITFPGMEAVAAARAAALASGAIKTKPKPTPADIQMPRWMGPSIAAGLVLIVVFTYHRYSREQIDLEAWRQTEAEMTKLAGEAYTALNSASYSEARAKYNLALGAAKRLVDLSVLDDRRHREAQGHVYQMEANLALVERRSSEPTNPIGHVPDGPNGSGSTPGSGSTRVNDQPDGPKRPDVVILPRDMTAEEKREARTELAALGIELVRPREIPTDKRVMLFLREDQEVGGELVGEADGAITVRDLASVEHRVSKADVRTRVDGQYYHAGAPVIELRKPDNTVIRGAPELVTRKGELMFKVEGRQSSVIKVGEVSAYDYYRAARQVSIPPMAPAPPTAKTHLLLGDLCSRMKLDSHARLEFLLAAGLDEDAALEALPQLAPDRFVAWRTRRKGTQAELLELVKWVADKAPSVRVQALAHAAGLADIGKDPDIHVAYANALADDGKIDQAEAHLKAEVGKSEGEKRFRLSEHLKTLESSRAERERERIRLCKRDVPAKFLIQLERELDTTERETDFKVALRRIRERATFEALLERAATEATVPLADAHDAFRDRRHAKLEAITVAYEEATWLADPPAALIFAQGVSATASQQQEHWLKLAPPLRRALLRGQFLESWYTCEVLRVPCPTCQGKRAINDFARAEDIRGQIDPECRGTGYHRVVKAK